MTLWEGRFEESMDPDAWQFNASLAVDRRLAFQDLRGSLAWASALEAAGVLTPAEAGEVRAGLRTILAEVEGSSFTFREGDEDIHSAVERRLGELIGPLAGKLHTGRSRNDQVATDLRLWLLDHLPDLDSALEILQRAFLQRAEADFGLVLPGYTHLQPAQPILLSHWWMSHFWPLGRDRERLTELQVRVSVLPLGAAALAGTPYSIDRENLAAELGFALPSPNSLDAVSDRDFVAEFLYVAAQIGVHLSSFAERVVVFASPAYGFFTLSDAFSTGSSLMPQKKNPDVFELARGKAGALIGLLAGFLATLKGLPSTYDKDLQEDKAPLFQAYDTLKGMLPVLAGAVQTLTVRQDRLAAALDDTLLATDLADYLVSAGMPFRQAHEQVGQLVRQALAAGSGLAELPAEVYRTLGIETDPHKAGVFDVHSSLERRAAVGGTAPAAVREQIRQARALLAP